MVRRLGVDVGELVTERAHMFDRLAAPVRRCLVYFVVALEHERSNHCPNSDARKHMKDRALQL